MGDYRPAKLIQQELSLPKRDEMGSNKMNPLIGIAAAIFPEILKVLATDKDLDGLEDLDLANRSS